MNPRDLPMPRGAVLAGGCGSHRAPGARGIAALLHAVERPNVAETEPLESRQTQSSGRPRDIAQRVAIGVAIVGGVCRGTDADAVENDDRRALHARASV